MPTVTSPLFYAAPLTPDGRVDDWCIDAVSRPPDVLFNFRKVPVDTAITDLRAGGTRPDLDGAGFEKVEAPTRVDQQALFAREPGAIAAYQEEVGDLLLARTGAARVSFFDATVRVEDTGAPRDPDNQAPHQRVHVDQSPGSAWARAADHGGPGRSSRRFQIVNAWRPLLAPVRNYPLALCDFRSLDPAADLVATRLDFPDWLRDRENYSVRHNPAHRWYFWDALTPAEVVLFKCYDSASRALPHADGATPDRELADVAGLSPHSAFFVPDGPATGRLRVSLEVRALLFHD
ncbi:CmcJ/NvfI family oxidoreductase [Saccharothrix lopnurensis]|uniref:CmcJ/NvfI family oxidoreductase n=1 Tax=Saccharothrix lopnurensis TaxID=1670621 RepID=A0ABW1P8P7_9PSEU